MFKGFVLSESLEDPLFLNRLRQEYVRVQRRDDSEVAAGYPRFWHLFKVMVEDDDIEMTAAETTKLLKRPGWYAHYWNDNELLICYPGQLFRVPGGQTGSWSTTEYAAARGHAQEIGIAERYLDFLIEA